MRVILLVMQNRTDVILSLIRKKTFLGFSVIMQGGGLVMAAGCHSFAL